MKTALLPVCRFFLLFMMFLGLPQAGRCQKVRQVCGEYTYYTPENVSLEEAKQTALKRARLTALADEFGTLLIQDNLMRMESNNGDDSSSFFSLSESEVKGEWLADSSEPQFNISYVQKTLVVKVSVCGKARPLTSHHIDFKATLLRNGIAPRDESYTFRNGDRLYLSFLSPAQGYLAVYLIDAAQTVYCLLPYRRDDDGQVAIKANQSYIFFNKSLAQAPYTRQTVDEYELNCGETGETNHLYIIFSPTPFTKATDRQAGQDSHGRVLPRQLSLSDFQKWLTKRKLIDKKLQTDIRSIEITP
ncbi:MAG: DUF4384 domain-containing protein [Bacteroides sp.]|nr:DUF4384 domain-containing protein [Bacteroides sp.]